MGCISLINIYVCISAQFERLECRERFVVQSVKKIRASTHAEAIERTGADVAAAGVVKLVAIAIFGVHHDAILRDAASPSGS